MPRITTCIASLALAALLLAQTAAADSMLSGSDIEAADANPYLRTDILMYSFFGVGMLHLADHVLRDDHSGFPFKKDVTPFTIFGLGVPAYFVAGYLYDGGPLYWAVGDIIVLASASVTHLTLEPPGDIYRAWTDPDINRVGASSPGMGRAAQVVTLMVSLTGAAHLISTILDGREHGWTWKRRRPAGRTAVSAGASKPRLFAVPHSDGGVMVGGGWAF